MINKSQIAFLNRNWVDSLDINMANTTRANLQEIEFRTIKHTLSDSITLVLSKDTFNSILE